MNNSTGDGFIGGGALFYDDAESLSIVDAVFVGNEASENGGAVFTRAINNTVESSRFVDNTATSDGGGIFCNVFSGSRAANLTIHHSSFLRNSAFNDEGGAVRVVADGGDLDVFNSTFEENLSEEGG